MPHTRSRALPMVASLLLLGVGVSCASLPAHQPAADVARTQDSHHHQHHHGGAEARVHSEDAPPSSFASHPELGTEFTCPVSGGVFEVEARTRVSLYQGRYYAMCCGGCAQDFDANPAHFVDALESQQATP